MIGMIGSAIIKFMFWNNLKFWDFDNHILSTFEKYILNIHFNINLLNYHIMIDCSEIYLFSDQPNTCPKCGSRTEIILELLETTILTQYHKCPTSFCGFEFIIQNDEEA